MSKKSNKSKCLNNDSLDFKNSKQYEQQKTNYISEDVTMKNLTETSNNNKTFKTKVNTNMDEDNFENSQHKILNINKKQSENRFGYHLLQ